MPRRAPIIDPVIVPIESESPSVLIAISTALAKSSGHCQKQYIALATASSATQPSPRPPFAKTIAGGSEMKLGSFYQIAAKSAHLAQHRYSISAKIASGLARLSAIATMIAAAAAPSRAVG